MTWGNCEVSMHHRVGKGINVAHKISRDTYIEGHGGSSGGTTATRRERSEKKR